VIGLLLLLSFPLFAAESYYCLQLASSARSEGLLKALEKVKDLPQARVEKIEGLYALRVGFFREKGEAFPYLKKVKKSFPDAFLRRCYRIPERVVAQANGATPRKEEQKERKAPDEELLDLLVRSFLGAGKLEEALKVLRKAVYYYPDSYEWWKTYGDVLLWTGRTEEAYEAYERAYALGKDGKLARKLFNLALSLGKLEEAKRLLRVVPVDEETKIYLYEQTGDVEGLVALLERKRDEKSLLKLANLYFLLGEFEKALRTLDGLPRLSKEALLLKYRILYAQRRFKEALRLLKSYPEKDEEVYALLSDLAWMLGDYETALQSSLSLIKAGKGRLEDYDRASSLLEDKREAFKLAKEGAERWKSLYLRERAIYYAYELGLWEELLKLIKGTPLEKRPYGLIMKAEALLKTGRKEKAYRLLKEAVFKYREPSLWSFYFSLLAEDGKVDELKRVLFFLRKGAPPDVYLSLAYGYLLVGEGRKALSYYERSPRKDPVLYGDILYLMGKEEEAKLYRLKLYRELREKLEKNPSLAEDPEFMRNFLSVAVHFTPAPYYEKLLREARSLLPAPVWREIYLAYLLYKERTDEVSWLARLHRYSLRPWMELSLALKENDKEAMQRLLERYRENLPVRDRVLALVKLGRWKEAVFVAFEELNRNPYQFLLKKQLRDLLGEKGDLYSAELSYLSRTGFSEATADFFLRYNLPFKDAFLELSLFYGTSLSKDGDLLKEAPDRYFFSLVFGKRWNEGTLRAGGGYRYKLTGTPYGLVSVKRRLFLNASGEFLLEYGGEATETLYVYLGAVKRRAYFSFYVPFLGKRNFLFASYELAEFYTEGGTYLGRGRSFYGELSRKWRILFPSFSTRLFFQRGVYAEGKDKGEVKRLSPYESFTVLPPDFTSLGLGLTVGDPWQFLPGGHWKPFLDLSWAYNSAVGGSSWSFYWGADGRLHERDRLRLYFKFTRNAGGVKESLFSTGIIYGHWY